MGQQGRLLHSRYQPQAEAERYVAALNLPPDALHCILIEPGLGYLVSALQKYRPDCKIVALHADAGFRGCENFPPDVPVWFPDGGVSVQEFLENAVPEGASARIIEWRPGLSVYGDQYLELVRESAEFIKRAGASKRTGAAFGKRWVRNFFRNLKLLDSAVLYKTIKTSDGRPAPVVITGSGPSLETALPKIAAVRDRVFVLASSSSVPALAASGITPDMVISTDGGAWALVHLRACFRLGAPKVAMLACALTAALPSQYAGLSLLPLNDGSLWQNIALHSLGIPSILMPQRGTVTASALDLALTLSEGGIFLAGMDLCVRDIQTHARPYGFDPVFWGAASRFNPVYSQLFSRSDSIRAGGSHDVYAAWFKTKIASWPKRIFSMGGNNGVFEDALPEPVLPQAGASFSTSGFFCPAAVNAPGEKRGSLALDALSAALCGGEHSAALVGELAPLLFPGRADIKAADIVRALQEVKQGHG